MVESLYPWSVNHFNDARLSLFVVYSAALTTGLAATLTVVELDWRIPLARVCALVLSVLTLVLIASGLLLNEVTNQATEDTLKRVETKYGVSIADGVLRLQDPLANGPSTWTIDGVDRRCDASGVIDNPLDPVMRCEPLTKPAED